MRQVELGLTLDDLNVLLRNLWLAQSIRVRMGQAPDGHADALYKRAQLLREQFRCKNCVELRPDICADALCERCAKIVRVI